MKDLYNHLNVTQSLDPATATATAKGAATDIQGYNSVMHVVNVGESGDTLSGSVYWTLTLQESDTTTDGDFTAVAAADMHGTNNVVIDAAAEDDAVHKFGYKGSKRYTRTIATATGTHTNGTPISMTAIRSNADVQPVS